MKRTEFLSKVHITVFLVALVVFFGILASALQVNAQTSNEHDGQILSQKPRRFGCEEAAIVAFMRR